MRRFFFAGVVCLLAALVAWAPRAQAQDDESGKFTVGGFADYYRSAIGTNMFGLGGRAGVQVFDRTTIEGEFAYDFSQSFNNTFTETSGGQVFNIQSNVKTLHALFGPKYSFFHGPIRPFVELKGGFLDYNFGGLAAGYTSYSNLVANLRNQGLSGTLLAGGGVEAKVGRLALRLDVGDELLFNTGTHNGLRVTFGPEIRF